MDNSKYNELCTKRSYDSFSDFILNTEIKVFIFFMYVILDWKIHVLFIINFENFDVASSTPRHERGSNSKL
jgi:hypothetical protein